MLNRRQFIGVLLTSIIMFMVLFRVFYEYTYNPHSEQTAVQEEAVEVIVQEEGTTPIEQQKVERILPTTKIKIELLSDNKIFETNELNNNIVMGMSREDLERYFEAYEIVKFDEQEVVLQKHIPDPPPIPDYVLGINEGIVGIVDKLGVQDFVSIHLDITEFSDMASSMIESQDISLSVTDRQRLQLNPYYIEVILQDYYE